MGLELRSLDSYNPITSEWNSLTSMKHKRSHCGMGVLGDHLYVIGGVNREGGNVLNSVERYSIIEVRNLGVFAVYEAVFITELLEIFNAWLIHG